MDHGVSGTASTPSLGQTMGRARSQPSMAAGTQENRLGGGELPSLGTHLGQDLHMTPTPHINGKHSPKKNEISSKTDTCDL